MYKTDEIIVHPSAGICKIEDIRKQKFSGTLAKEYYILTPVYESVKTTIYVPVDSDKITLRRPMKAETLDKAIKEAKNEKIGWIENDNQRYEAYLEVFHSGNQSKIISLITTLHKKQVEKQAANKKLRINDEKMLKDLEKLIYQEIAYVFGIELNDTASFVMNKLGIKKPDA